MKIEVIKQGKYKDNFLQLSDIDGIKELALIDWFKKKKPNWFVLQKMNLNIPLHESFMNEFKMIPIGLWKEAYNFSKANNISFVFDQFFPSLITDTSIKEEDFTKDVEEMFKGAKNDKGDPFFPYEYQIKACFQLLKYKKAVVEVSTSGGKTLISFILFKWLYETKRIHNFIFFAPNVNLVKQTIKAFEEYESFLQNEKYKTPWRAETVYSGTKYEPKEKIREETPNIVLGTYQTLSKYPKKWFELFDTILGDECHHITAKSVQKLFHYCNKAIYKFGVSGTPQRQDDYNGFLTQSFIGPVVYTKTSAELINDEKKATPVIVIAKEMDYYKHFKDDTYNFFVSRSVKPKDNIQISGRIYHDEITYMRNSKPRFDYIISEIKKTVKNALVLFADIKGEYGKKIYQELYNDTTKNVYYIDGNVSSKERAIIIDKFENDDTENSIIVASIGVFSEGIDLKRLWNIYLVESLKAENTLAQILGRGMRKFKDKKAVLLFDFQDDLDWKGAKNPNKPTAHISYLHKHAKERIKIYKKRGFMIHTESITL